MKLSIPAGGALLALLLATCAHAQCPEPSALDLRPLATPLRIVRSPGAMLRITFEDVAAPLYAIHRGSLASFEARTYDHRVAMRVDVPYGELPEDSGNAYFVAGSDCGTEDSSVGRDSDGVERPVMARARLRIGLTGGTAVFGAQVSLSHGAATFFDPADAMGVGPFAAAAAGSPMLAAGAPSPGLFNVASSFTEFSPDPSFEPPAVGALEIYLVDFDYMGAEPTTSDFSLPACDARDQFGEAIPGVVCSVTRVTLLP